MIYVFYNKKNKYIQTITKGLLYFQNKTENDRTIVESSGWDGF